MNGEQPAIHISFQYCSSGKSYAISFERLSDFYLVRSSSYMRNTYEYELSIGRIV